MIQEVLVDEAIEMLYRVTSSGEMLPTSFIWRDRTRYVAAVGRQWEERIDGKTYRCYLIQSVDNNTFEARWDPVENLWTLHRAWLRPQTV